VPPLQRWLLIFWQHCKATDLPLSRLSALARVGPHPAGITITINQLAMMDATFIDPRTGPDLAARLTDHVLPRLPARQWVLSVPKRVRPYLQHDTRVDTHDMLTWQGSGGFSVDASVRIEAEDRAGLERLVRSPTTMPPPPAFLPNPAHLRPHRPASAGPSSSRASTRCFRSCARRVAAR